MATFGLDYTQFSPSWLRKEFVEKIKLLTAKKLYGPIFKSTRYKKLLGALWRAGANKSQVPFHRSVGVISDGSFDTIKGLPYIFPLAIYGEHWKINTLLEDNVYVQAELKRYNKIVQDNHRKLILLCTRLYEKHLLASTFSDSTLYSQST
ncbi:uncharacterized protein LOC113237903 [Hyposmocoma kahamanoa]|uniref:uncharacterized protein LOC113237903 n=1 Tax=Hyposmocoma kahamanoa TaxID=1477025 RepID=UPI000E6D6EF3|nr:uncharacterized protein LOC113237903 [Hyposmocoma kahamanoa]